MGIRESDSKFSLLSVGNCVIVQLNHFFVSNGAISKNFALFFVLSSIEVVTELEDEVFCIRKFYLSAIINHSGNLNSGHYKGLVKERESTRWHCNDGVVPLNMDDRNKLTPYVLFLSSYIGFYFVICAFICRGF